MSTRESIIGLAGWCLVVFAAAWFGAQFTATGPWYDALRKPSWNPPSWLFAPVWTLLYIGMAVAAWMIWKDRGFVGAPMALGLFLVQLLLNAAWSWLFFGIHRPWLSFYEIVALWLAILGTIILFWQIRPLAGWLLVPYLAWVTFASALTLTIARMNPETGP